MPANFAPSPLSTALRFDLLLLPLSKTTTATIIHTRNLCFRAVLLNCLLICALFLHTTYLLIFLIKIRDIT